MSEAEVMTDEVLSIAEINARYANHWILVADPVTDEHLQVKSGRVACASPDRDVVYDEAVRLRLKRGAVLYNGPPMDEENEAMIL